MNVRNRRLIIGMLFLVLASAVLFNACVHDPFGRAVVPATNDTTTIVTPTDTGICFDRDILPIFVSNCAKSGCHNAASHEDDYILDSYTNIIKKGIDAGRPSNSKIWKSVIATSGSDKMPKDAPSLSAADLNLINRWITQGAKNGGACTTGCDSNSYTYSGAIAPLMTTYCTGCHSSSAAPGGSLKDYNSVKTAAVSGRLIGNISHLPGYNAMPPGIQLSQCQVTQVKKWVAAGAPNN